LQIYSLKTLSHKSRKSPVSFVLSPSVSHGLRWTIVVKFDIRDCSEIFSQQDALFLNFVLVKNSTCFGQTYCPSSGVLILYSQHLVFVILETCRDLYKNNIEK